jgi:hypothetical protein
MFGGRFMKKSKPVTAYERRAKNREAEYARLGLTTFDEQQEHERRKVMLGEDYRDRFTGTWKEADEYMKKSQNVRWWDWFLE